MPDRIPLITKVNEIFKKHSNGRELSDVPARAFTGMMTLLDAINRAGSTDPEKISAALAATDIPADQLIVPYKGVKFDAKGQNELVRPILMQVQKGKYCTIYPFELASCEAMYPAPIMGRQGQDVSRLVKEHSHCGLDICKMPVHIGPV